jgi:Chaperone of endosialidase
MTLEADEPDLIEEGTPRRAAPASDIERLSGIITGLQRAVGQLQRGQSLRGASISGPDPITIEDDLDTVWGRIGALTSAPGQYGAEFLLNGVWRRAGAVSEEAEGSSYGFNNIVAGTTTYPLYVGNSAGFKFGRAPSSIRYKTNVRPYNIDPQKLFKLQPRVFDRIPQTDPETGETMPAAVNEYGLIAEEVAEWLPEIVTYFDHGDGNGPVIDGVRYDLIGLALLDVIQDFGRQMVDLRQQLAGAARILARFEPLGGPTSKRPADPVIGQQYLDSTLGRPIWAAQISPAVVWKDAAGVTV